VTLVTLSCRFVAKRFRTTGETVNGRSHFGNTCSSATSADDFVPSGGHVIVHRFAVGSAIAMVSIGLLAPIAVAAKAPKAGDSCTPAQLGKTSGKLTCVKDGNRRKWVATPSAPTTAAAGTAATTVAASGGASGGAAIKIGVAIGLSGASTANLAQDQKIGVGLAEKYINDKGGINGRKIQLVIQDTSSDEAGAIAAFNALIDTDKVVGIVGPTLSQQAFAADPIAERKKVPVLAPSNTAAGVPQIGDYIARVSAGVATYAGNAVKYAATIDSLSKAAVFFADDDAFSRNETVVFQNAVKAASLELLPPQTFKVADTDFTTQVNFVRTNKPDLVVISGLATAANLVKQLRDSGFKGSIVGGNGLNVVQTFSVCKQQCDGLIVAQAYSPEIPNDGVNAEFRKIFLEDQKREPGQIAAQAFTAVFVYAEALKELGKASKLDQPLEALRTDLNKQVLAGKYTTPLGDISFTAEGEINQKNFYVAQISMKRGATGDVYSGVFKYVKF
jgi:branched-chain amino acid transport system substrate-binding protein